jgi:hypothetical protein
VLGLAAEVLTQLGALDAEVQSRLRRRDHLRLLVRREGADAVALLLLQDRHVVAAPEEWVALPHLRGAAAGHQ